jgi:hypothetical protein
VHRLPPYEAPPASFRRQHLGARGLNLPSALGLEPPCRAGIDRGARRLAGEGCGLVGWERLPRFTGSVGRRGPRRGARMRGSPRRL